MTKSIPYNDKKLEFDIPSENLIWEVTPKDIVGCENENDEVIKAILNPIGTVPLKEMIGEVSDKKIAIVVDDNTRVTPAQKILDPLIKILGEYGVQDKQIFIIFALGSHRAMTEKEMRAKVGNDIFERLTCINHEYDNDDLLVDLGKTSQGTPVIINSYFANADIKICIGNIIPQFIAGWSGGAKIIEPGISGKDTTAKVHLDGSLDWPQRLGNPENNIRLDMEEIARIAKVDFIINTILNLNNEIVNVVAGDVVKAHRKGVEYARKIYEARIPRRADIVIAGTYPANKDMWQADKGLAAASLMVKPGGTVIWCPPCTEGVSPEHPVLLMMRNKEPEEVLELCRNGEIEDKVGASAHIMIGVMRRMSHVVVCSDGVTAKEAQTMGFEFEENINTAISNALLREGKSATIGILTHGADIAPFVEE